MLIIFLVCASDADPSIMTAVREDKAVCHCCDSYLFFFSLSVLSSSYMEEEDFTAVDANLLQSVVQEMVIIRTLSKGCLLLCL